MERIEDVDVVGGMHQRCGQEGEGQSVTGGGGNAYGVSVFCGR